MELQDVKDKIKRKNQILFNRKSECLQELLALIRLQNHRTLVMWCFDCLANAIQYLGKKYPMDTRAALAYELSYMWAHGEIKMKEAKRAILDIHGFAKELDDPLDRALCHAIGQGCGCVHVETHAIGMVFYELTALVLYYGIDNCEPYLEQRINEYIAALRACEKKMEQDHWKWADFLLREAPNKEMVLYEKEKRKGL